MSTATAKAYQPRFAGRFVPFEMRKSPQNKAFYGHRSTYSGKAHCIKDRVLLDPACGSGNFLTETYLSLRKIENEIIKEKEAAQKGAVNGQIAFGDVLSAGYDPIKVSISQFYGIEINDFAVSVAKAALWIAESQMLKQTEDVLHINLDFLPLKTNAHIIEANALRIDWNDVICKQECSFIMGNPPFSGSSRSNAKAEQKEDMNLVFGKDVKHGKLDYVAGWYWKAASFISKTHIRCAFVSTNSITQGEQVALLWKSMFDIQNIDIDFAYRSFLWKSEAKDPAAVVCVIVSFSCKGTTSEKYIFVDDERIKASHINGYLHDLPDTYLQARGNNLNNMPKMIQGNKPWDGGHLLYSQNEYNEFMQKYPDRIHLLKPFYGGEELVKGKKRYCLWLKGVSPAEYASNLDIRKRLQGVREARLNTKTEAVRKQADTPMLFSQIRQPDSDYLAFPEVSGDTRRYIPIGFLTTDDIASNKLFIIPGATKYMFGVLTSNVHMAWMRVVAGRLGTGYSYSPSVYNNFPWPSPTDEQKETIEQTAQSILDARALYPDSSLANLYDPLTMPAELQKAHIANNRAVMAAYGFSTKMSESECVAELMKKYQKLVVK